MSMSPQSRSELARVASQAMEVQVSPAYVVALESVSMRDVARVGGKNASLGELLQQLTQAGVRAVGGFATEVSAYWAFIAANELEPVIRAAMTDKPRQVFVDCNDPRSLASTLIGSPHVLGVQIDGAQLMIEASDAREVAMQLPSLAASSGGDRFHPVAVHHSRQGGMKFASPGAAAPQAPRRMHSCSNGG